MGRQLCASFASHGVHELTVVDYQLGNGKRSSLAVPQHLPALVSRFSDPGTGEKREASWSSGTVSRDVLLAASAQPG